MRIYIHTNNISNLNTDSISKYLIQSDYVTEIYSEYGIFVITNGKKIKEITIKDGNIYNISNYLPNYNAIIDTSMIFKSKEPVSHIPHEHYYKNIIRCEYKESIKSPVSFIIEYYNNKIENTYFMLTDKHAAYSEADIMNPFTKESIQFFLTNTL
tara:strand:- start:2633 stop:3097 length:465 start_codon:yes stop_codon:yes gene_type:complete